MEYYFESAVCTDKGNIRSNNEDNFCLNGRINPREEMDNGASIAAKVAVPALFAVCDGMGGEANGEEASFLSASIIADYSRRQGDLSNPDALNALMMEGCQKVLAQAQSKGNRSGSTVTMIAAGSRGFRVANMGDSRIYRLSGNQLVQLSRDHTEIDRLLKAGEITRDQIKTHPKRHMIYQYWGMPIPRAPFMPFISLEIPFVPGERYLLCSDGLTDMLEDREIAEVLSRQDTVQHIAEALVRHAKRNGGRDNVTVMVVETVVRESSPDGTGTAYEETMYPDTEPTDPNAASHGKRGDQTRENEDTIYPEQPNRRKPSGTTAATPVNEKIRSLRKKKRGYVFGAILSIAALAYLVFEWLDYFRI